MKGSRRFAFQYANWANYWPGLTLLFYRQRFAPSTLQLQTRTYRPIDLIYFVFCLKNHKIGYTVRKK